MADLDDLPAFLDPLLDYLAAILPPPIYTTFESLLGHAYTLLTSLLSLLLSLSRSLITDPGPLQDKLTRWWDSLDATEILPPLITLLCAYLALVSFYRTSRWMISVAFAFVKWGVILTTLGTAAGYYLANAHVGGAQQPGGGVQRWGVVQAVGGLVNEFLDSQERRTRVQSSKRRGGGKARPKAYDSWDKHEEWQYTERTARDDQENENNGWADVQKVVGGILAGDAGGVWQRFLDGGAEGTRESRRARREGAKAE